MTTQQRRLYGMPELPRYRSYLTTPRSTSKRKRDSRSIRRRSCSTKRRISTKRGTRNTPSK
ncbi:MAG TPA: hypothetical protein ENN56_00915 [Firmicutes bacterium]|nr:hypothetical protein [Bacillota bacterium]